MENRYKKILKLWFSKDVCKEMLYHIENNYGFDDDDFTDEDLEKMVLDMFRDVYFEIEK